MLGSGPYPALSDRKGLPGGRVFLVANGPSLAHTPLDLLIGEESWGMARIHLIYDRTSWRPTRYWWSDHPQDQQNMDDVLFHIKQGYPCWIRSDVCQIIDGSYVPSGGWAPKPQPLPAWVHPWPYCIEHNAGFMRMEDGSPDTRRPAGWHLDSTGTLCKYGSGYNCMLQQAVLEGFNPIYLVGADLGFRGRPSQDNANLDYDHFDLRYNHRYASLGRARMDNETQVDMHVHARTWCDARGIQVFNATLGGELEVYPRVDFVSLFPS